MKTAQKNALEPEPTIRATGQVIALNLIGIAPRIRFIPVGRIFTVRPKRNKSDLKSGIWIFPGFCGPHPPRVRSPPPPREKDWIAAILLVMLMFQISCRHYVSGNVCAARADDAVCLPRMERLRFAELHLIRLAYARHLPLKGKAEWRAPIIDSYWRLRLLTVRAAEANAAHQISLPLCYSEKTGAENEE